MPTWRGTSNHSVNMDEYGKEEIADIKAQVGTCYQEYMSICRQLKETAMDEEQRKRQMDFLEFEINPNLLFHNGLKFVLLEVPPLQ